MEALERRGKILAIAAIFLIVLWSQCTGVEGHRNSTRMSYVCPPQFIRLGQRCYYFSETQATWQNALFACKDRDSNLTVPERWEDRHLRNYLNSSAVVRTSRWIGGIYDYMAKSWKWGGELRAMRYQSFSKMRQLSPEQLQWHCIAMIPELSYRWSPRSCIEPRQYICQTKLQKVPKAKVRDLRRRWQRMGKINEITAPSVSRENDPATNDVTANPVVNAKAYDLRPSQIRRDPRYHPRKHPMRNDLSRDEMRRNGLRPNDLRKRAPIPRPGRKLTRPFPGYSWNRNDPEASFKYNSDLLRSGKTGLSPQKIKGHLDRLSHMRDHQLARQRRIRDRANKHDRIMNDRPNETPKEQPLVKVHARTYTIDNNISALHPKMIVEEFDVLPPPPSVVPMNKRGARRIPGYG